MMARQIDGQYFENCSCEVPYRDRCNALFEGGSGFANPFSWAA